MFCLEAVEYGHGAEYGRGPKFHDDKIKDDFGKTGSISFEDRVLAISDHLSVYYTMDRPWLTRRG